MTLAVNVLCRNFKDDRVIPRFSRYLRDHLGWNLTARPDPAADVYYLSGYFEWSVMKRTMSDRPVAAYFTHLEESPPGNGKAKLFHALAGIVDLRLATAMKYATILHDYGPTALVCPGVERGKFTIPKSTGSEITVGFSGYTYGNGRKGENLAKQLVKSGSLRGVRWMASGRGWPVQTRTYPWSEMENFYRSLDVLVVTALVEGVPMPPLEALACGVSIVIPRDVGLHDEIPDCRGVYRYKRGSFKELEIATTKAVRNRGSVDRERLRSLTDPYTIQAWCEQHRLVFEEMFE